MTTISALYVIKLTLHCQRNARALHIVHPLYS